MITVCICYNCKAHKVVFTSKYRACNGSITLIATFNIWLSDTGSVFMLILKPEGYPTSKTKEKETVSGNDRAEIVRKSNE